MNSSKHNINDYLSPAVIARWWKVHPRTVVAWGSSGSYPVFKQGYRVIRIKRADVINFMHTCYRTPDSGSDSDISIEWGKDELLTISKVASILKISTRTVMRWVHDRKIAHFKFSSRVYRFFEKDILTIYKS